MLEQRIYNWSKQVLCVRPKEVFSNKKNSSEASGSKAMQWFELAGIILSIVPAAEIEYSSHLQMDFDVFEGKTSTHTKSIHLLIIDIEIENGLRCVFPPVEKWIEKEIREFV